MAQTEAYDFRKYDRIWQRVAPTLEPYPEMGEAAAAIEETERTRSAAVPARQLPGAIPDPCCMGSGAEAMLGVLTGFVEEELEERRQLLALAQQAPVWARQKLRDMAGEEEKHARRLMAVYYLVTGECYCPHIRNDRICVGKWCPALRERYHVQACSGMNYARAGEETTDPCLSGLLRELSVEEYRHADRLLRILEQTLNR